LCPDGLIIGIDYAYGMLELSRQILTTAESIPLLAKVAFSRHDVWKIQGFDRHNIALVGGYAENLPFKNILFDCVLGNYIFSIVDDYKSAIHKAVELLKPGGIFITTNSFSWEDLREPERRHNPDDLKACLKNEGLHIELDFDFANINTANSRQFHIRNTRLILGKKPPAFS
jgi:SAM-dependent methyltransferase